jgi:queuine tRNA-ribosyltransferase
MAEELLAYRLLSLHNLHFFARLMTRAREAIAAREFRAFKARFLSRYAVSSVTLDTPEHGSISDREA